MANGSVVVSEIFCTFSKCVCNLTKKTEAHNTIGKVVPLEYKQKDDSFRMALAQHKTISWYMYIIDYFYVTFCVHYRRAKTMGIDLPPTLLFLCHAITIKDHEVNYYHQFH
jgi:hypothetical protein